MRCTTYRLVLAALLICCGTLNTLLSKWTTISHAINSVGIDEPFQHPFLQATGQFLGEFCCLILYFSYRLIRAKIVERSLKVKERKRHVKEITVDQNGNCLTKPGTESEITFDQNGNTLTKSETESKAESTKSGGISVDSEAAVIPITPEEDIPLPFTWKKSWLFLFPAICDTTASCVMYVAIGLTSAASYQMLRGSVIIFTGLASRFFLRKKLAWYKWLGMLFIFGGLFVVGSGDLFSERCVKYDSKNNRTLCDERSERLHNLLGDAMMFGSQIVVAIQNTYEEKVLKKYDIAPLQAIGWEGFFGFSILSVTMVAMDHIGTNSKFWGHSPQPPYHLEDPIDGFTQLKNNPSLLAAVVSIIISITIFQVVGISVTKEMSATTRMILDSIRVLFVWIISLSVSWQPFHFLQILGFICIMVGMCFYYNLLIVPHSRKAWRKCRAWRAEKIKEKSEGIEDDGRKEVC